MLKTHAPRPVGPPHETYVFSPEVHRRARGARTSRKMPTLDQGEIRPQTGVDRVTEDCSNDAVGRRAALPITERNASQPRRIGPGIEATWRRIRDDIAKKDIQWLESQA